MPYIEFKTNVSLNEKVRNNIAKQLGEEIKLLNKSESWLMLNFVDEQNMYFKGLTAPCIIAEVKLYGQVNEKNASRFTESLTNLISKETNISLDRIYINYFSTDKWGYSGSNF